ncbi:MAG: hypothetical protein RBQ63_03585 [Acholeplasmatales bacterium]|nr:hypothetical protein [Acholeplasmatales bacterium]
MSGWRKKSLDYNPLLYEFVNDDGITIRVRKGTKGNLNTDILVTITDSRINDLEEKNIKHIYWAVDVLMKKEHNKELMNQFLRVFVNSWNSLDTFKSNNKDDIEKWIQDHLNNIDLSEYEQLNSYGFLSIKALHQILMLLSGNEKSAREDAFMFKTIITRISENDADIYDVIAWADNNQADIKWSNKR